MSKKNAAETTLSPEEMEGRGYLSLRGVGKQYVSGDIVVDALKDVTFDLENGQFVVVLGSSGAGKTTLLNLLGGMDNATSGEIVLDGKNITTLARKGLTDYRRNAEGYVFQFYTLKPNLTALENVEIAVEICKDHLDPREVLTKVGLEDRMNNFPAQLSGGEQQRVSIARAIAKSPKLLLCDEPTGALDYKTGKNILSLLYNISKLHKKLVVVVTHNSAIREIADKVIRIRSGQIESIEDNPNPMPVEQLEW